MEIIEATRTLPLSSSVKLDNKEEVLELLAEISHRIPEEVRQARWLLKEREDFLEKTRRDGDEIVEAARQRSERMVQRTEIVREADQTARRIVEAARDEARRLRLEAEDYCDQKLAAFEIVLDRTMKTVSAGRERLSFTPAPIPGELNGEATAAPEDEDATGEDAFFDQDRG
jgi:cell division septum initiation protein DivIVA